jgi:CheY-like chemotaxis protein
MVVDDDSSMRITLEGIIEEEGYCVVVADDGYQAIELAKKAHFDLIFLDIKMPGIDGVEAFKEIVKVSPDTVVVMMTGFSLAEVVEEGLEEGAYAVLYKPFDVHQIIDIIQSVQGNHLVLVVDDRAPDRETLRVILEDSGYEVSTAESGNYAVSMATERHFDIILMDIRMPGIDGFAAFQEIRRVDPLAKVVFITGYALENAVLEAVMSGAYSVLTKPVNPDEMLTLMKSIAGQDTGDE